jgi:DNA-binding transcriptional MocR family regulator
LPEKPTYSGALAFVNPIGCRVVEVDTDGDGMVGGDL